MMIYLQKMMNVKHRKTEYIPNILEEGEEKILFGKLNEFMNIFLMEH